ncbi:phosphatase PAP2 family protein [Streptomyces sp. NPDC059740]|uniref:phosphatase PAP2 family protein n=1 Tax=Streptomyces sp. NPDC059740 TaxID=3346926 RepID=UPI0036685886
MSALALDGSNPDLGLLEWLNQLARDAPGRLDAVVRAAGDYGVLVLLFLVLGAVWWVVRRRDEAPAAVASLVWALAGAGVAVLANIPIREFVARPRPYRSHPGLTVLADGDHAFSFVSDHATAAMAIGVGLFMVRRSWGLVGVGLAVVQGLCQVYLGAHYPTDVIGGYALGAATVLLLSSPAQAVLVPLCRRLAATRLGGLVRAGGKQVSPYAGGAVVVAAAGTGPDADGGPADGPVGAAGRTGVDALDLDGPDGWEALEGLDGLADLDGLEGLAGADGPGRAGGRGGAGSEGGPDGLAA